MVGNLKEALEGLIENDDDTSPFLPWGCPQVCYWHVTNNECIFFIPQDIERIELFRELLNDNSLEMDERVVLYITGFSVFGTSDALGITNLVF